MLERAENARLTARCGHHPDDGFREDVGRLVEHETRKCLDCDAIRRARKAWEKVEHPKHKSKLPDDHSGPCPYCADELFWIESREPLPTASVT